MLQTEASAITLSEGELARRAPDAQTLARAREIFLRDGHLTLHQVFPVAFIEEVHAAYTSTYRYLDDADLPTNCLNVGHRRYMVSLEVAPPVVPPAIYGGALLLPFLIELLGDKLTLGSFTNVLALPGARSQHIHRDLPLLFMEDYATSWQVPPYCLTVSIPLVDLTPETGTTALWTGSHRDESVVTRDAPVTPFIPRGSAFLFDARTVHAGMANDSAAPRPIYYITYNRGWFRDESNFSKQDPVAISTEALAAVPEPLQPLFRFVNPT